MRRVFGECGKRTSNTQQTPCKCVSEALFWMSGRVVSTTKLSSEGEGRGGCIKYHSGNSQQQSLKCEELGDVDS